MTKAAATRFLERTAKPMVEALEAATRDLTPRGFKALDNLIGRETEQLVETLDLDVAVRGRDFLPRDR